MALPGGSTPTQLKALATVFVLVMNEAYSCRLTYSAADVLFAGILKLMMLAAASESGRTVGGGELWGSLEEEVRNSAQTWLDGEGEEFYKANIERFHKGITYKLCMLCCEDRRKFLGLFVEQTDELRGLLTGFALEFVRGTPASPEEEDASKTEEDLIKLSGEEERKVKALIREYLGKDPAFS